MRDRKTGEYHAIFREKYSRIENRGKYIEKETRKKPFILTQQEEYKKMIKKED